MTKLKQVVYESLKYFLFFILLFLLSVANVSGLHPFAFGMLFALVWCNQKIYVIAPLYVLSGILVDVSLNNLLCLCVTAGVFVLFYLLHLKLKKPLTTLLIGIYAFLSQFAYLYLNSYNAESFVSAIICVFIGIVCLYAYLFFMQSLLIRGLRRRYTLDEIISAGVLCVALGVGISCMPDVLGIFSKTILLFLTIFFVWIFSASTSISFSVLLALGAVIGSQNLSLFLSITLCSIVCNIAKSNKKIFAVLSMIFVDLFVNLYFFSDFNAYMLLSSLIAATLFLLIPNKSLAKLSNIIICESDEFALRNIIKRSRSVFHKRLWGVSEIFLEMQNVFMSMAKGNLSPQQSIDYIISETKKCVCEKCAKKNDCLRANAKRTDEDLKTLIALSLARGKVNVLDVPSSLSSRCRSLQILINTINNSSKEYNSYVRMRNGMNESRILIADQLFGVSQILKSLASEVNLNITFDVSKEKQIIEELLTIHILCSEAVVYFKNESIKNVTLVVRKSDAERPEIGKIVSKILNSKMEICSVSPSDKTGFCVVTLRMFVPYDVLFGSAGVMKNGGTISGDTHSVLRLGDDKILMALCDGMGSGSSAEKVSSLALSLIENFYKAGFDSSIILSNVNKLITMKGEENFSALDICVFDLRQSFCDIVKLGSPMGFLKRKDETYVIEAGALPLGIIEDVKPNLSSYALNENDMIILMTDGVIDAFGDFEELKAFVNDLKISNPQTLADCVLEEALRKCGNYAPDDMTILIGKIWQKI